MAIVVLKKDSTWRVCIDYRDLNAATQMDAYPLPRIDDLLHRLARAQIYSKVDLHSGFHQIPMEETSIPLTAFRVPEPVAGCSHYEWVVMPMGLSTAPPTFQRWMETSLHGFEAFTLVYLDDVLVYSTDEQQHQDHLRQLFQRFQERGMKLKARKCTFFQEVDPVPGTLGVPREDWGRRRQIGTAPRMGAASKRSEGGPPTDGLPLLLPGLHLGICCDHRAPHRATEKDPTLGLDRGSYPSNH